MHLIQTITRKLIPQNPNLTVRGRRRRKIGRKPRRRQEIQRLQIHIQRSRRWIDQARVLGRKNLPRVVNAIAGVKIRRIHFPV